MVDKHYAFYVTTKEGEDIVWEDLTEIQAFRMNRTTDLHAPSNILRFGWGVDPKKTKYNLKREKTE